MRLALADLIALHGAWLHNRRNQRPTDDAGEWLYHFDALTCLWRMFDDPR